MDPNWAIDGELVEAAAALPAFDYLDLPADRRKLAELVAAVPVDETGVRWHSRTVAADSTGAPPIDLRVYCPDAAAKGGLLVHVHSGGWVVGDLAFEHVTNVHLVRELQVALVSVDYRLAPEHPYPAGLDDCVRAWAWTGKHLRELGVDPGRTALVGGSAGAALSVGVALRCRDEGRPMPRALCLNDPALDDRLASASAAFEGTPVVDRTRLIRIWDAYLGPGRRGGAAVPPYAAPLRVADLAGLPPTYLSAAEFDPVRDDALAFGAALSAAGVPTELHLYPGTFHGSSQILTAAVSRRAEEQRLAFLRRVLAL